MESNNNYNMEELSKFLRIISEENRLEILYKLKEKDLCVCEIFQVLNLSQNLTSHHLKVLKDFGLISAEKKGSYVIYSLNPKTLEAYLSKLNKLYNN